MTQIETAPPPEAPDDGFVPAIVLRNKGVPVVIYRLENDRLPEVGEDEELPTRRLHLRFDANAMSSIEEAFDGLRASSPRTRPVPLQDGSGAPIVDKEGNPQIGVEILGYEERNFYGLEAFQKAMEVRMTTTVRNAMAIAFGLDFEAMGRAMIPSRSNEYQLAVGVAWSIAQGVDPTVAARTLAEGRAALAQKLKGLESRLSATMEADSDETTATPGPTG